MLEEEVGMRWQAGVVSESRDAVAAETTFELFLDGASLGRSIVSPADLREWGAGHAICEGWLRAEELAGVELEGDQVLVRSSRQGGGPPAPELVQRSSAYLGRQGAAGLKPLVSDSDMIISPAQVEAYAAALSELAPGWRRTGGLHVALLYDNRGQLIKVAEDVGRHNAVDKVVGAGLFAEQDLGRCVLVVSGRMPEGMVTKVVRAGIPVAVTKAASTDLGINAARRFDLTLICFARPGRFTVYSGGSRVSL
jgi:FdhD protein